MIAFTDIEEFNALVDARILAFHNKLQAEASEPQSEETSDPASSDATTEDGDA